MAFGCVGAGDGVDDGLGLFVPDLLVVVYYVSEMVAAGVVGFTDGHGVVG